jgi:uncharacterized protein YaiE (UPF0345 family)
MPSIPTQFANATVLAKANVYFDGNVISHAVILADGARKTLGLIRPGAYHFGTGAAERMELVAGAWFDVPANSGFTIEVKDGLLEYICSYIS